MEGSKNNIGFGIFDETRSKVSKVSERIAVSLFLNLPCPAQPTTPFLILKHIQAKSQAQATMFPSAMLASAVAVVATTIGGTTHAQEVNAAVFARDNKFVNEPNVPTRLQGGDKADEHREDVLRSVRERVLSQQARVSSLQDDIVNFKLGLFEELEALKQEVLSEEFDEFHEC
ncbi:hypothetical protein FI667_g9658, partial [Globisporangium splendens]